MTPWRRLGLAASAVLVAAAGCGPRPGDPACQAATALAWLALLAAALEALLHPSLLKALRGV